MKCNSRIRKSSIIDLGAGLLIGDSRVYLFYYVFGSLSFKYIQNLMDRSPVCINTR